MAEATREEGAGRRWLWVGAACAGVWLLVLLVLAVHPFFYPVDLRHGLIPSGYGFLWAGWGVLGPPVAGLFAWGGFRELTRCRRLEGDYYFCEFRC